MTPSPDPGQPASQQATLALRQGRRADARRWAQQAAALAPDQEEPWLMLAALASPRASVEYLQRALQINPASAAARKGMHWAAERLRAETVYKPAPPSGDFPTQPVRLRRIPEEALVARRPQGWSWVVVALLVCLAVLLWTAAPTWLSVMAESAPAGKALVGLVKPTFTPTPTATSTPTPTPTPTSTPTPTPTDTPTPLPTDTPVPTDVPPVNNVEFPDVGENERWIDVNLSQQMVYAYVGKDQVNAFLVSTGTYLHPTVTGQYHIYVKYTYADMSGPGYYLPAVPYVMYFYDGYGLHGTYWHSNFGTPMSHGCINLRTDEAGWLFNWASVGTLVNIHY
ncbi:MAG: L,D-transpeptidase [Anaerolineaceae bacterium]